MMTRTLDMNFDILGIIEEPLQPRDAKTAFQINLKPIKHHYGFTGICFIHNSLIIISLFTIEYMDVLMYIFYYW